MDVALSGACDVHASPRPRDAETKDAMTSATLEAPQELAAEFAALQALAVKHRREYMRLKTIELAKLRGETPKFTRDRMTQEQLAELPPVEDSTGTVIEAGMRVRCPDGVRAVVRRVDKRSKRCVVDRADQSMKMTVAKRLTVISPKKSAGKHNSAA